jgi:hypothetical protein
MHFIEAGTFHAASPNMAATLSLSSPRVTLAGPHILMPGSEPIDNQAARITPEEVDRAKQLLLQ